MDVKTKFPILIHHHAPLPFIQCVAIFHNDHLLIVIECIRVEPRRQRKALVLMSQVVSGIIISLKEKKISIQPRDRPRAPLASVGDPALCLSLLEDTESSGQLRTLSSNDVPLSA